MTMILKGLRARHEVVEGLLVAVHNWDLVSSLVEQSVDAADAAERLRQAPLSLTEAQAAHVLAMRQSSRTTAGRRQLEDEERRLGAALGAHAARPDGGRTQPPSCTTP